MLKKTKLPTKNFNGPKQPNFLAILLGLFLVLVLLLISEQVLVDLNNYLNPLLESREGELVCAVGKEATCYLYQLGIDLAIIFPLVLLAFYCFFLFQSKKIKQGVLVWSFLIFGFWLLFRLLVEVGLFLKDGYQSKLVYLFLGAPLVLIVLFVALLQKQTK